MNIIKMLKGGSLSKTFVIQDGSRKFVRKSISYDQNREFGLVRWQSQIRKLQLLNEQLPERCVSVERIGVYEDSYFYDIPYFEGAKNCYEALLDGEDVDIVANEIIMLLSKMAEIKYGKTQGALSVYLNEEVRAPLQMALNAINQNYLILNESEIKIFSDAVSRGIFLINKIMQDTKKIALDESLTHGNLTLENVLWNNESKTIIMIDPYAETYCEAIMCDVSQVYQSCESGYEFISDFFEKHEYSIDNYPIAEIPDCLQRFSRVFTKKVKNEAWYSEEYLMLLRASQFIRMFPFKMIKSPRQGAAFMMHGIDLLERSIC